MNILPVNKLKQLSRQELVEYINTLTSSVYNFTNNIFMQDFYHKMSGEQFKDILCELEGRYGQIEEAKFILKHLEKTNNE
jgi:hypothetical protein